MTPVTFLRDRVACTGNEDQLGNCGHKKTQSCSATAIAGVQCPSKKYTYFSILQDRSFYSCYSSTLQNLAIMERLG